MARRSLLVASLICLALLAVIGISLIHPNQIVKATGGSICLGNCAPPSPPTTCLGGGTNPSPGVEFAYPIYSSSWGTVASSLLGQATGCKIQVSGIDANYVESQAPTANNTAALEIWESSSSTCSPVSQVDYVAHMAVGPDTPADHFAPSKGGLAASLTNGTYVCAGFNQIDTHGGQSLMVYWSYE